MGATFSCDFSGPRSELPHFWEHTIGSDHAPMALRADWQAQLRRCHDELGFRHVRFHGLLSDDVGTLIWHRAKPPLFVLQHRSDFRLSCFPSA